MGAKHVAVWMSASDVPVLKREDVKAHRVLVFRKILSRIWYQELKPDHINITYGHYVDRLVGGIDPFSDRDYRRDDGNYLFQSVGSWPVKADGHVHLEFRNNILFRGIFANSDLSRTRPLEGPYRAYAFCPSHCPFILDAPKVLAAFLFRLRAF